MNKQRVTFPVPQNEYGIFAIHTARPDILNAMSDEQRKRAIKAMIDSPATKIAYEFLQKSSCCMS